MRTRRASLRPWLLDPMHSVVATAASVSDAIQGAPLLHGQGAGVPSDAGYSGVQGKRPPSAARRGRIGDASSRDPIERIECPKASSCVAFEHSSRVIRHRSVYAGASCRGSAGGGAQVSMPFAPSHLWMARKQALAGAPGMRLAMARRGSKGGDITMASALPRHRMLSDGAAACCGYDEATTRPSLALRRPPTRWIAAAMLPSATPKATMPDQP